MSYYFYDLETSGLDPRWHRIMQFAGQRTDENFKPIGEPHNIIVRLSEDVLPDPYAILVTGITPQKTLEEGISEPEFLKILSDEVFTPNTIMAGFNSIRFDDEFMRFSLYRNFYDPYEREWSEGRTRWDIIDLVRMTRALRPDGIQWPQTKDGKNTNRLEEITKANGIDHFAAHDALSDVEATIAVAKLIQNKQPKLYEHLLSLRQKNAVKQLIDLENPKPIVHSSGKFSTDVLSTSVVFPIAPHPTNPNAVLVYDLRFSPKEFADLNSDELAKRVFTPYKVLQEKKLNRLPVKAIHINKSPAVAPLGVLDESSQERINLTIAQVEVHLKELLALKDFAQRIHVAWESSDMEPLTDVDGQLYDGFLDSKDKLLLGDIRGRDEQTLADFHPNFVDERYDELLFRYKARNYPKSLSADEKAKWDQYRHIRFNDPKAAMNIQKYYQLLAVCAEERSQDSNAQFLIEELNLYAQSIMPFDTEQLL